MTSERGRAKECSGFDRDITTGPDVGASLPCPTVGGLTTLLESRIA
jgi:hypothetical protein